MTENITRRFTAVFLALVMAIGLLPTMTLRAYGETSASISLLANDFTFNAANEGYAAQPPFQAGVHNSGSEETGDLTVTLEGDNSDAFELSKIDIPSLPVEGKTSFNVYPKTGLMEGTYNATVTVSGSQVESKGFNVSFTVNPPGATYTATIRTYLNDTLTDVEGTVELGIGTGRIALPKGDDGIYEASVENGDYTIYINANNTGRSLVISGGTNSVTLNYYTVEFSASTEGNASNGKIGATVNSATISSGAKVLKGDTVTLTAAATGASSYTYTWSGSGTNGETEATLSINVKEAIQAECVITGSGDPIESPDYEINHEGYNWTGTNQTVILSGANDVLTIHNAPTAAIKIEVQSADDSEVTLESDLVNGKPIVCSKTTVVVSNKIKLNLKNIDITAPTGSMEDWHLFTALLLKDSATIDVSGTCNISGNCNASKPWYGHGIASEQDNITKITGSGTLNVTGGSASNGNGGEGIHIIASTTGNSSGAKLFIEDGVTVIAKGGNSAISQAGNGITIGWGDITIDNAKVEAYGGEATGSAGGGGTGILASFFSGVSTSSGDITIIDSQVTAAGGASNASSGGNGISASFGKNSSEGGNIVLTNSTIKAIGGKSTASRGGGAISATNNISISGGAITATGGDAYTNGAHGVFSDCGAIVVKDNTKLLAKGGNGTTDVGGVGVRAYGNPDGVNATPGIVTIANNAGAVYIRGGQGVTAQRASIMGRAVYIGTGNIGNVMMEGVVSRSIKNTNNGDDLYLVKVTTDPADTVEIRCEVNGGSYIYRAVADKDGTACLWLPVGEQRVTALEYGDSSLTVVANDTSNKVTLSKQGVVTAYNTEELKTYMAASYVNTINLVSGTTYSYDGAILKRDLTIHGNGAVVLVGTGITDTIVKKEGNSVNGPVFLAIENASLNIDNVTLLDESNRILAAINVKTGGSLLLDGVRFEGFFTNLETDPYPAAQNIDGSHNNFGVHAEPGAVTTTVKNCDFGATNSFRNAIAIRNGVAVIKDNIFVGTDKPERQNQTDGCEYAVYLYGGICTVTGNDIKGYDSVLKSIGYHSAAISTCPYYSLVATISDNRLYNNARGIDGVGAWHTYSYPADVTINGTKLVTSQDGFKIGEVLKNSNVYSGNTDGDIAINLDQNDYYIDATTGVEFGPPVYYAPLLKVDSTTSKGATLSFDKGVYAKAAVRNAKNIGIQVSEDNGVTWKAASVTGTLNALPTNSATVNLVAGKTYLLRTVMTITANTRPVNSIVDVIADITCYSNTVSVKITASGGGGSSSGGGSATEQSGGVPVIVNGETKTAGTAQTAKDKDGRTITTVTVDSEKLESILASKESGATVVIPVTGKADAAAGVLTGEMVKNMEKREATLVVKTETATYTLPAEQINIQGVSQQLGKDVALKDIAVSVSISEPSKQMSSLVEQASNHGGFTPVMVAVDFTVTCSYGGRAVDVSSFNAYVERTIAIPNGVDPTKITTGIVVNPDGTTRHVPTRVTVIDNKYYAVINSLTNSTYSVVWNPVTFLDVNNHWAKASINNMGSRMVVGGVGEGNYEPDRDMTRAEFAAIMVRALGLEPDVGVDSFSDVTSAKWYSGYVKTATTYGIIKGYSDSAFGPDDKITREQAMAMLARAMKITGLKTEMTEKEGEALISIFTDSASVSSFAVDSAGKCLKAGIVSGRGKNTLMPKAYITRAEVAAMIERLLQKSDLI